MPRLSPSPPLSPLSPSLSNPDLPSVPSSCQASPRQGLCTCCSRCFRMVLPWLFAGLAPSHPLGLSVNITFSQRFSSSHLRISLHSSPAICFFLLSADITICNCFMSSFAYVPILSLSLDPLKPREGGAALGTVLSSAPGTSPGLRGEE